MSKTCKKLAKTAQATIKVRENLGTNKAWTINLRKNATLYLFQHFSAVSSFNFMQSAQKMPYSNSFSHNFLQVVSTSFFLKTENITEYYSLSRIVEFDLRIGFQRITTWIKVKSRWQILPTQYTEILHVARAFSQKKYFKKSKKKTCYFQSLYSNEKQH